MTTTFLTSLIPTSFVAAIVGFTLLIYALRINRKAHVNFIRIGVSLIGQLVVLVASALITGSNEDKKSRLQLRSLLDNKIISMTVDGKLLDSIKTKELSLALSSITDLDAHHSHPIDTIKIQVISGRDTLNLTLGQDSQFSTEYWVFADKHSVNEIGRIRTQFFTDQNGL
jgi:hypothetical protein